MSQVTSGAIPREYKEFYSSLPCHADARDALVEPDVEKEEDKEEYVEI